MSSDGDPMAAVAASEARIVEQVALRRGKELATATQAKLGKELMTAIGEGGFTNALSVCSVKAPALLQAASTAHGVEISRITHKARNPVDQATAEEQDLIRALQTVMKTSGETPAPVILGAGEETVSFYAPIVIGNPLCLNCHGSTTSDIQPATLARIHELYPHDEATGFKFGDLRGLWRIRFPRDALLAADQPTTPAP